MLSDVTANARLKGGTTGFTAAEEALATTIGAMWAAFAATGVPTHPDPVSTVWPRFINTTDLDLVLDVGVLRTEAHPRAQFCDFWSRWTSQQVVQTAPKHAEK